MTQTFDAVSVLAALLTEHGPLTADDIEQRLRRDGVADPDAVLGLLDELSCPAAELLDGRWAWLPALLAGRVFTHRVSAQEAAHDLLTLTPDLDPITELCQHAQYQQLADGSPVQLVLPDFDYAVLEQRGVDPDDIEESGVLLLAEGTLAALELAAGDLVGLRLTGPGLVLQRVDTVAESAVGAQLAALLDPDEPVYCDIAVDTVCAADPAAFTTALAPLSQIADEQGLACDGEWLAPGGFDFGRWHFEQACVRLARRHNLDADDAFALNTLLALHGQLVGVVEAAAGAEPVDLESSTPESEPADGEFGELLGDVAGVLADPALAEALMEETGRAGRAGAAALGMLAETLEPKVPRAARVATRWLHAVALERLGDTPGAERELLAAESVDPDWPLPLFDLARIASDRGDAEAGLALLHRAGAEPDHPLVQLLEQHRITPRSDLGRNEPCWCGSGRKYKKCHLHNEQLPLTERVSWLYTKAIHHVLLLSEWRELLFRLGYERGRYTDDDIDDPLAAALSDPLVADVALFEGGAFEAFLESRGSLLPDDERLLAQQWLLVERSVFEVQQVQPGHGVTVRDVRTGDVHQVSERTASRALQPGQLICARAVPAGDGVMQFFGGIEPVALPERDALIDLLDKEPDPVTLVAYLTRRFAPPTLVNTEGESLAQCQARVQVSDPAALAAELDDTYERVDDDELPRWLEFVTTDGMQRVRAGLTLVGDTVQIETNSENRLDRVLAVLRAIDPGLRVLDDARIPMGDARQLAALADQQPAVQPEPDDPELIAFMEQTIRGFEDRWLDEPIPALNGVTPRQAAADPTRRDDLVRLLNSFPSGAAAGRGMDADRLRAALGLT